MPIQERECGECATRYEVLVMGSAARIFRLGDRTEKDPPECPACQSTAFKTIFNTSFHAVGLGGEAGVGRFYPYRDRGLGPGPDGRGLEVRDAKHREWLMTHTPGGALRPERLIPLESDAATSSGLRGTWDDIADHNDAVTKQHEAEYDNMVKELSEGPNREAYHKVMEHAPVATLEAATETAASITPAGVTVAE